MDKSDVDDVKVVIVKADRTNLAPEPGQISVPNGFGYITIDDVAPRFQIELKDFLYDARFYGDDIDWRRPNICFTFLHIAEWNFNRRRHNRSKCRTKTGSIHLVANIVHLVFKGGFSFNGIKGTNMINMTVNLYDDHDRFIRNQNVVYDVGALYSLSAVFDS